MPREVVDAIIPELCAIWVMVDALLGVLVAAIVPEPDIEAQLDEGKGKAAGRISLADPNLAVHQQTMVQINDGLAGAVASPVGGVAASEWQPVQSEQVAVLGEDDMFLVRVAKYFA